MEKDLQDRFKSDSESDAVLSEKGISIQYQLFHDVFRKFEEELKRNFDSSRGLDGYEYLDFHGLEPNLQGGFEGSISFESNMIKISRFHIPFHSFHLFLPELLIDGFVLGVGCNNGFNQALKVSRV